MARRSHSRAELRRKLGRRGYDTLEVDAAVARLAELGLQDDRAFAEGHVRRRSRSLGPLALSAELVARGIDRRLADGAMVQFTRDEQLASATGVAVRFQAPYATLRRRQSDGSHVLELKAQQTLLDAETQAKEKLLEAKEEAVKVRTAAEQEAREYRAQSQQIEKRILQKEENLDRKGEDLNRSERELAAQRKSLDDIKAQLEESYRKQEQELQRVANMTRQEAQGILMAQVEQDLRNEVARKVRESELVARDESERRAREIVTESIQRVAADQTAEVSVSVLPLPTDELKGRIIGKEGRNIRALQQATGIDLIVDDTPEAVIISGFDPVRREVARVALNKLIVDGRIHPARIEEI